MAPGARRAKRARRAKLTQDGSFQEPNEKGIVLQWPYRRPQTIDPTNFWYLSSEDYQKLIKTADDPLADSSDAGKAKWKVQRYALAGLMMETDKGVESTTPCELCVKRKIPCRLLKCGTVRYCAGCRLWNKPCPPAVAYCAAVAHSPGQRLPVTSAEDHSTVPTGLTATTDLETQMHQQTEPQVLRAASTRSGTLTGPSSPSAVSQFPKIEPNVTDGDLMEIFDATQVNAANASQQNAHHRRRHEVDQDRTLLMLQQQNNDLAQSLEQLESKVQRPNAATHFSAHQSQPRHAGYAPQQTSSLSSSPSAISFGIPTASDSASLNAAIEIKDKQIMVLRQKVAHLEADLQQAQKNLRDNYDFIEKSISC
ncbi:hypothetical protein K461DRAFT_268090 [Myriangium duriaei CBS 260.36]|uniref:Zn(2)-C6 fungal-type domain-containing protein n=1 Tax=Myriangium duriaei CBS 260.36 TaxID=1168546 RepID=A0A9P4MNB3_9PEZI|nr:hypothetical protein K461DRAFT_268090 [Myriangium duriaei CBS 260.36]